MSSRKLRVKRNKPLDYASEKKVWYAKLAKSGFVDVEYDEYNLKRNSGYLNEDGREGVNLEKRRLKLEQTLEYYSMCRRFLWDFNFQSKIEKVIWEYHSESISCRNIAKILKEVKTKRGYSKSTVHLIVQRLEREMKKLYMLGYNE